MHAQKKATEAGAAKAGLSALMSWPVMVSRTVSLGSRMATVRLEHVVWEGLDEIAQREGRPVKDLCQELDGSRSDATPLTSAIRSYVLDYFRRSEAAD